MEPVLNGTRRSMMKRRFASLFTVVALLLVAPPRVFAELRTISWDPVTTYTDNTPIETGKTVSYTAYWTADAGLSPASLHTIASSILTTSATFDPDAQGMTRGGTVYFTAKATLNTGEESALSPAYAWVVPVIAPPPAVLTSIAISGPSTVNEGGTATYTATGTWDNGTTVTITPTWSENSSYATISAGGVLTASPVTSNQSVTVTASYTSGGVTKTATKAVTIVDVPALASIAIGGPSTVNEGGTATYTATGTWDNGTTVTITPAWSENSSYATISAGGVLTASPVTSDQSVTVTASYTSGGVTKTATKAVTIVDVPGLPPAAPKNIGISGPITSGATEVWRLAWDPVTTYADDAPLEPGRTVRYTAYWTDDPALSAGSLRQLASSISATSVDIDPVARQMPVNQPAWLAVRCVLDTGGISSLSDPLYWVVANAGPVPPVGGMIIRK
jgi:hypothetical protein